MPKFHKDYRVYTDSLIQIAEGINDLVNRLEKSKIRFGPKRKLNKARTLNGLYIWFLRQNDVEQDQIIKSVMPILYQHHEAKERLEIGRGSVPLRIGRKRDAYSASQSIVDGAAQPDDKTIGSDRTPQRRR